MQRIIVIVVLSVLTVVLSGCDKIKTELERRHLGMECHKQTVHVEKTSGDKHNDAAAPAARKQIVIRIDLPTNEKLQIRLIKLPESEIPESEAKTNDVISPSNETPPKETVKEDAPRAEVVRNKPEKSVEPEKKESTETKESDKKTPIELEAPKSEEPQSEIKTDAEQEPKSEMKTDREEPVSAVIPASAPMVIVPAREPALPPLSPDAHEISALSQFVKSNPAPAEAAVGSALSTTPPSVSSVPALSEPINSATIAPKASSSSPWAIPNADYPLRYY